MKKQLIEYLEIWFHNYRWCRKLSGGHWEKYWVDVPITSDVWHKVNACSLKTGHRPMCLCRGTPTCEDWPNRKEPPAMTDEEGDGEMPYEFEAIPLKPTRTVKMRFIKEKR